MANTSNPVIGHSESSGNNWVAVDTSEGVNESITWNFDAGTITLAKGSGRKTLTIR